MPPKKKATRPEDQPPTEAQITTAPLATIPEQKKEEPIQTLPKPTPSAEQPQQPKPSELTQPAELAPPTAALDAHIPQKIVLSDSVDIPEQERIRQRKLRFGITEATAIIQDAQKVMQERLKKFGGSTGEEDQEAIEKRKQKFATSSNIIGQDLETLKKRLQKFSNSAVAEPANEDEAILAERRKKFGKTEAALALEEELSKTKPIQKFHPRHNPQNNRRR